MRLGFLALLAVACSSGTTESTSYRSESPTSAYQIGAPEPSGPLLGLCSPSCKLSFPDVVATPEHCWSLSETDCVAANGGWYNVVPECGQAGLWVKGCYWNPSGGCNLGIFYEAFQSCEP